MKKFGILVLAVSLIAMSFTLAEENYQVDVANSTLAWKGYKPTGNHSGTVMLQSGNIVMKGKEIKSGTFVANMTSIKDIDGSAKLEGHLKSKDFFEVKVFPTAKFEITKAQNKDGKTLIVGNLTIKNITKEISFKAMVSTNGDTVTLEGDTFQINRIDYNIKYKSKSFFNNLKEKFINDKFDLKVKIVAKK